MDLSTVFDAWTQNVQLSVELPRIGMGASCGGAFLFSAYVVLKFKAIASYIMWASFSPEDTSSPDITLPATAFVYMPRDERSKIAIPQVI